MHILQVGYSLVITRKITDILQIVKKQKFSSSFVSISLLCASLTKTSTGYRKDREWAGTERMDSSADTIRTADKNRMVGTNSALNGGREILLQLCQCRRLLCRPLAPVGPDPLAGK